MPALNFQKQFAESVKNGSKKQTIRTERKVPIKEGDTLYLYTGMRTKHCEKLGEVKCKAVIDFNIFGNGLACMVGPYSIYGQSELNKIAVEDGFRDWHHMAHWFKVVHGLPFEGKLILWD